jgi:ribosomal protein S27AE
MGKFCTNCGAQLKDKAAFCSNCGSAVAAQSHSSGSLSGNSMPGLVGFSRRINDPEVIKEIEDRNKKGRGCIFIGIPLPFIIFLIVSFVSDEVDTLDAIVFGSYNKRIPGAKSKFAWLSCDDSEVEKYENDPLCGNVFSIGFYYYFFNALKGLYDSDKLSGIPEALPIFIVSGNEDPVGKYGKKVLELYDFYKKLGLLNVQIKLYPGKRHEILNETGRQEVYDDILSWLETQIQL